MTKTLMDALARETELAAALSDITPGIVVVMDLEGKIVFANRFLARLAGHEDGAALEGKSWFETFLPPADQPVIRALYQRVLQGEPVVAHRNPVVDREGTEHEIEWSSRRLFDASGQLLGVLSVGIEHTEAARARRALEIQQARFASVVAGALDGFVLLDGKTRIIAFNPAAERIFGYAAAEVLGRRVDVLLSEPWAELYDRFIADHQQTGAARPVGRISLLQGRRRGGEAFPIEVSLTLIGVGDEARSAAFIRDVTETVRLRERASERQRLADIGTTAAKFAHEVGNPLNGMLLNLQLISRRIGKAVLSAELAPLVDRVEQEVRRLAGLLNEFRSMSRRQSFMLRPIPPQSLLEEFVQDHRREYEARGITVQTEWSSSLPLVHVDREKITQVLLNLAKNAVEAMSETGGVLRLRVRQEDVYVVVEVGDDGGGIPEGVDVFEPFATTKSYGTGLGLPVAKQIVAAHGGELDYRSEPGRGTTFRLCLPVEPPAAISSAGLPIVRS
ncbi:MAG: PAS domain S-box protein [Nannocystaceae bacterium]